MAIPLFALSALYVVANQSKKQKHENFENLPNTDIPNKNYPDETVVSYDTDVTSKLSTVNRFENAGGVYTDKYFSQAGVANTIKSIDGQAGSQATYYSLTGEKVDGNYFQHNNMVPFFGSHLRNNQVNANRSESVLDNYVGAGSQYVSKSEQAPLFAPSTNESWAHGAPNMTDFYQSRVNPSMRQANVKPFEEQRVAPGLGLGFGNEGMAGFNSGMLARESWLPKTVDQMRIDSKPKAGGIVSIGYEGPATSYIKNYGTTDHIGKFEKNRPDRHFELGSDRLFTTTGIQKGTTLRSIESTSYKDTTRQFTATDYTGAAGYSNNAEYITGEYMPSHNQQLGELPLTPANASNRNYATDSDFGIKSKTAYPNNRSENKQDAYFGMVSGGLNAAVAPLLDMLRPSRRENVIGTLRPYQNPGTTVPQSYIFNPADRPAPTIRETTENSKFHLNVNRNQNGGAYEVTDHQPIENSRQTTGDFFYSGGAGAGDGTREMTSYAAGYNQRNNDIKSSTIQGHMVKGNMSLMNGDINMRQVNRDGLLQNVRDAAPTMPYQTRDINNMGHIHGQNQLYSNIQLDRNNGEVLSTLQGNPYALNIQHAF